MLYTVTNVGIANGRPTQIGVNKVQVAHGATYVFTIDDFTTDTLPPYSDPEGDGMAYIKLLSGLIGPGLLQLNGVDVTVGQIISAGDISTGNLTFTSEVTDPSEGYSSSFDFDVADTGSNSLSGLSDGQMGIEVSAIVNLPPDVIGDITITVDHGDSYIFSSADFTSLTTPPYNDPEGDLPFEVKVIDLPGSGTLLYNGLPVSANQIISVSEIDAGYLAYHSDASNTSFHSTSFNFSVADAGSGSFTQ